MLTKRFEDGQGWMLVDNTCSGGTRVEDDLLGCGHCPVPIPKARWTMNGGWRCHSCHKPLCEICRKRPPTLKCVGTDADQLERALSDLHRREQNAKVLGI